MESTIFYYTGTGNSLWVARTLAESLGNIEVVSLVAWMKDIKPIRSEIVGIVFPVHIWGVPAPIIRFIKELNGLRAGYIFAVGVNAGGIANTLVQLKNILAGNGLTLSSAFSVHLPSNYIPWGGPGPQEKQNLLFEAAGQKISGIVETINKKENGRIEKGPLWARLLFTQIYKISFPRVPKMDEAFWVDQKCNHCGICGRVCPAYNIAMVDGRPIWRHRCEQCLACLQWCPKEAIQSGKKTPRYQRYHNPNIQLKDVLKS